MTSPKPSVSAAGLRVPIVDLGREYASLKTEIDAAVTRVLASGQYILGPESKKLEERIAELCGAAHAVGVNSGTDALALALEGMGVGPGTEVITCPFTFFATAEAIVMAGARPVFADMEPESMTLDPERLAGALSPRTKAVIPIHLYGQTADMPAILAAVKGKEIHILEDMAQALGASQDGRPAGSWGRAAAISFYPTKNLGACGDGGMIVTDDEALAAQARKLRSHGADVKYRHDRAGYNSRLDEVQAALLNVKLDHFQTWNHRRTLIAAFYDRSLQDLPVARPRTRPGARHVFHLYTIRTPRRDRLHAFLKERGIDSGVHYPVPLHLAPALAGLGHKPGDFPESEKAASEVLSLPLYAQMTDAQAEAVVSAVREFFDRGPKE